jgi:hypothetical protein
MRCNQSLELQTFDFDTFIQIDLFLNLASYYFLQIESSVSGLTCSITYAEALDRNGILNDVAVDSGAARVFRVVLVYFVFALFCTK